MGAWVRTGAEQVQAEACLGNTHALCVLTRAPTVAAHAARPEVSPEASERIIRRGGEVGDGGARPLPSHSTITPTHALFRRFPDDLPLFLTLYQSDSRPRCRTRIYSTKNDALVA